MRSSLMPSKVTRKGYVALGYRRLRLDDQMVTAKFAVMDIGIDFVQQMDWQQHWVPGDSVAIIIDMLLGIWRHRTWIVNLEKTI